RDSALVRRRRDCLTTRTTSPATWTSGPTTTTSASRGGEHGLRRRSTGGSGACRRRSCACCPTWPAWTSWSSAAGRRTSRRGSPDTDEPAGERLVRPMFGMHRFDAWEGVEFHLPHGEWIRLLRANGFEIEDLIEVQAPPDARTHEHYDYVTAEWGRRWPAEEI